MNYFMMIFGLVVFGIGAKQQFLDKKPAAGTPVKKETPAPVVQVKEVSEEKKAEIKELESNIQKLKLESADPEKLKVLEAKLAELKG